MNKQTRPGRHRLSMDVPLELWDELIKIAEKQNITITKLVLRTLFFEILKEQKYE